MAESAPKADLLNLTRKIVEKAVYSMSGGYEAALRRTRKRAHKVIVTRLGRLTSQVPVLSAFSNTISYSERAQWNHFWLVDPLSGSNEFSDSETTFTVNIALVEDGRPIYGVVYAPDRILCITRRRGGKLQDRERRSTAETTSFGYPNSQRHLRRRNTWELSMQSTVGRRQAMRSQCARSQKKSRGISLHGTLNGMGDCGCSRRRDVRWQSGVRL